MESGICSCSHVSVKHTILDTLYSLCVLMSASSSSTLFASDLTFPVMTAGMKGLNFLFSILRLSPALQPRRLLFSSSGMVGLSPAKRVVCLRAISWSRVVNNAGVCCRHDPRDPKRPKCGKKVIKSVQSIAKASRHCAVRRCTEQCKNKYEKNKQQT